MVRSFLPQAIRSTPEDQGFTITELLIVISIIGILSAVVLANVSSSRQLTRDRKRVADLELIRAAVQSSIRENGTIPSATGTGSGCPGGWGCSYNDNFMNNLVPRYFEAVPRDPRHPSTTYFYLYRDRTSGPGTVTDGCRQPYYTLIARLETGNISAAKNDQSCWTGLDAGLSTSYVIVGR